jgi:hypothetical protein
MRVSPLFSLPVLFGAAFAQGRTAAEAAQEGNLLLAQGAYGDAARAYGEAIRECCASGNEACRAPRGHGAMAPPALS